ncbi:MAG: ribokinase [Proteobacteria bacterium]|nr:ribokinase [Pseudomonadota bacterium]
MNRVLVVGSINMDLVVETDQIPTLGETLLGQSFTTHPGGKGANQAVAASRLGATVTMIGCVGSDVFGTDLINGLNRENIDTRYVRITDKAATGVAIITVSQSENAIIVVPGANHALMPDDLFAAESAFAEADVVISQLEIPLPVVQAAAELAARHGKPFLLNPAPAMPLPDSILQHTTLLTPNEHELAIVFSTPVDAWQQSLRLYPAKVIMTKGRDGAWFTNRNSELQHQPGFPVRAVDTTGAGDTFNGTLAAFWGGEMGEIARLACAAGALSVTRAGAQGGMPNREELFDFLKQQSF